MDDLLKELPEGELEDLLAVQPDGGGGDSGGAPPPSLDLRNQGRHNVWDEEDFDDVLVAQISAGPRWVNQSMSVPDAQPESSVLLARYVLHYRIRKLYVIII